MPDLAAKRILSRIQDIRDAIEQSRLLLADRNDHELAKNRVARAAFERFLEVISEASRHIPDELKAGSPEIEWRAIAAIGNQLRHGYQKIDVGILWDIQAKGQLEALDNAVVQIERILTERHGS